MDVILQRTALHLAASEGSLRVADYLITNGANVNVVDRWGNTPLQDAVDNNHELLAKLIRMHGGVLREHDGEMGSCYFRCLREFPLALVASV